MPIKTCALGTFSEKMRGKDKRVLILGLGNILLKDEGIGSRIAQQLQELALPANVEVMDAGTAGLDVLLSQTQPYKLVIIDAVNACGKPGAICITRFPTAQINRLTEIFGKTGRLDISLHQIGLLDALNAAEALKCAPQEIIIIGVEPGEIACGLELTEPVSKRVPEIIDKVLEEIKDDIYRE